MAASERRSWDDSASQDAQGNFNRIASRLEALLAERDADVKAAMADYTAQDVSESYQAKEHRWSAAGDEVRQIINKLRASLESNDQTAQETLSKARSAVDSIG